MATTQTTELTADNFDAAVADNDIVLVDFWAGWCGPCQVFGPMYEQVAGQYPDVVFGKVDVDVEQQLAQRFGVRSIPTVAAFKDGEQVFAQPGVLPPAALHELVEALSSAEPAVG